MTVLENEPSSATLVLVDSVADVIREIRVPRLNADLSTHVDVPSVAIVPLSANLGLSFRGIAVIGQGFVLDAPEAQRLVSAGPSNAEIIRPFRNGRDLTQRPRDAHIIDFGLRSEDEAREYPVLYDLVRTRVKPERDANPRATRAKHWWRFGEPIPAFRAAVVGLRRYIATPMTAKHRFFTFLSTAVLPDQGLIAIASSDPCHLGVLSASVHVSWAIAAGGRLGVGNDPRYNNTLCFDPFPFPPATPIQRAAIAEIAEALDAHRKEALARDERVTMTGMYNVLEKLRSGEALTAKEREIHEAAACGVLLDLHEGLDRLVAAAYGWPWPMEREEILERLVALHGERVAEEAAGEVRWLRPAYQIPKFGGAGADEDAPAAPPPPRIAAPATKRRWPSGVIEQLSALQALLGLAALTPDEAAARFEDAPIATVRAHLELLSGAGEAWMDAGGRYHRAEQAV